MAFLLMYVSRDTRRIDFRGLTGSQRTPRDLGRHSTSQDASREAYASLEDGVPVEGPPNADELVRDASSETTVRSLFLARVANAGLSRPRLPNWLMLGSYVPPQD